MTTLTDPWYLLLLLLDCDRDVQFASFEDEVISFAEDAFGLLFRLKGYEAVPSKTRELVSNTATA